MTAAVITSTVYRAGTSSAASPSFLTAAQVIGQPFPLFDKIILKVYLTHADRRATLWLDFRISTRRYMMTASAHNLIGPATTLEAALF